MTRTDAHHRPTTIGPPVRRGWADAPTPPAEIIHPLGHALIGYVRAVAAELGVPEDGVTCEVTDTATAYVALGCQADAHPDRDVMLVWDTRGWSVLVETTPAEPPIVLAPATGDLVPHPSEVARVVAVAVARPSRHPAVPPPGHPITWSDVVDRMNRHSRPTNPKRTE